jgi:sugar/nucleoside kinase (ribokinase family)
LLPEGGHAVGGTVTYAAAAALNLGLSAAVLTSAPADLDLSAALEGIDVHVVASPVSTTFENIYEGHRRYQVVHGVASPLRAVDLPDAWRRSSIVLLGPVVGELGSDWLEMFPGALLGATPQGWMRQWDEQGRVTPRPWEEAEEVLSHVDVLVFSEEDVSGDEALIHQYAEAARVAAVTRGQRGATVFQGGLAHDFPAFRVHVIDPTGAGDVFAAAFLLRLNETGDPHEAALFANCVASFAVEGKGTATLPTRDQVEERLRLGDVYG